MQILKAKLADLERQKRVDELNAIKGEQRTVGFGSQIRSYVLAPYQMVKDLRSEHETGNVDGVLDGDLDPFMEAYLRWQREQSLTP
jgi:peptide chain release factor 2